MGSAVRARKARPSVDTGPAEAEAETPPAKKPWLLIAAVATLLVGGGVAGVLLLTRGGGDGDSSDGSDGRGAVPAAAPARTYGKFSFAPAAPAATMRHNAQDFTQGWEYFSDVDLIVESTGLYGQSVMKVISPETGEDVGTPILIEGHLFGEGISTVPARNEIYQLTWREKKMLVWDYQTRPAAEGQPAGIDLTLKDTVTFPRTSTGEGWGMCNNGTHFFVTDGSHKLHVWTIDGKKQVARVNVYREMPGKKKAIKEKIKKLNELECLPKIVDGQVHTEVLANVWFSTDILRIDAETGRVIETYDLSAVSAKHNPRQNVLNGIAYNAKEKHLYVTGKNWDEMYRYDVSH